MKKLLLMGLIFAPAITINAQEKLVAQDKTFYINRADLDGYLGDLTPLVHGGTPPYLFDVSDDAQDGSVSLAPNGEFLFNVSEPNQQGSFGFHVIDANGMISKDAKITIVPFPSKEKLK